MPAGRGGHGAIALAAVVHGIQLGVQTLLEVNLAALLSAALACARRASCPVVCPSNHSCPWQRQRSRSLLSQSTVMWLRPGAEFRSMLSTFTAVLHMLMEPMAPRSSCVLLTAMA
jgi:hypothetical protein